MPIPQIILGMLVARVLVAMGLVTDALVSRGTSCSKYWLLGVPVATVLVARVLVARGAGC